VGWGVDTVIANQGEEESEAGRSSRQLGVVRRVTGQGGVRAGRGEGMLVMW
jgi:hypothetical protein